MDCKADNIMKNPGVKKHESIQDFLPRPDKLPEIAVYWFSRYLSADKERERLMSLYNGLGCLPGGFPGIPDIFIEAGEEALAKHFLEEVEKIRKEDDETGPFIYECGFSAEDFKKVEKVIKNHAANVL